MRIGVGVLVMAALALGAGACSRADSDAGAGPGGGAPGGGTGPGGGGGRGGFGGGAFRPPMAVELSKPTTGDIAAELNVVGNLIGAATVDVVPRTGGRLVSVNVKLGDRVGRGQLLAKIEDQEITEQVKQAEASFQVAQATIRQREADLKFAEVNLERSKSLFERQLLPRQSLDDAEARAAAATAQLDLARAQFAQAQARLDELRINLANTSITSPVNGFVGKRNVDPGAWASNAAPVVSVVDISSVRLVANVVEKDLRLVSVGDPARVEVDAFPGEAFSGRIARVAPVLDPTTRTAEIEIEVPNADFRLKPGMYARMSVTVERRTNTTLVPKSAVVDYNSTRGVFTMTAENKAKFLPIETGLEDAERVEVRSGITTADTLVTGGASSLRDNDTLVVAGQGGQGGRRGPGGGAAPAAGAERGQNGGSGTGSGGGGGGGGARKRAAARPGA
ncbi:MAG: efflux RND transporter periplasmic adaptor subunit [Vicinamibacterales bacterium]